MSPRWLSDAPSLALVFGFGTLTVAISAGGLGAAPVIGTAGGVAALGLIAQGFRPRPNAIGLLVAAFVGWAATSFLWSDYTKPNQLIQMLSMSVLSAAYVWAARTIDGRPRAIAGSMVVFCAVFASGLLALEALSGFALTRAFRPLDEDMNLVLRNLGHGGSSLILLTPPAILLAWRGGALGRAAAVAVGFGALTAAFAFGLAANIVGIAAAAGAMGLAAWRPRWAVRAALGLSAGLIAFAPIFGQAAATFGASWADAIPLSWASRIEAWRVITAEIVAAPLFGHGFDSVRLVVEPVVVQGVAMKAVRMHPHNVGLHIWYETGLIGAALASAAFLAAIPRLDAHAAASTPRAMALAGVIASLAMMNTVSYGVWQPWWIASAAAAFAAAMLVGRRSP